MCHENNTNVFNSDWEVFWYHDCSINWYRVVIMTYQNLSLGMCWKLFLATLRSATCSAWKILCLSISVPRVGSAQNCMVYIVFHTPSEHRLNWAENIFSIRFNCLFSLFLQYATDTKKWKKARLILSKNFIQQVSFQVQIKYVIWI